MGRVSKIEKYNLSSRVDELLNQGVSYTDIVKILKKEHPEIIELRNLSPMSILRYKDIKMKRKLEDALEEGRDPVDELTKEFRAAIRKILKKTDEVYKESKAILEKAKETENINDQLRAIREVRDSLEQERKNWVALAQYGVRQATNFFNINIKKEQNVKILLLNFTKELCPECRAKVSKLVEEQ